MSLTFDQECADLHLNTLAHQAVQALRAKVADAFNECVEELHALKLRAEHPAVIRNIKAAYTALEDSAREECLTAIETVISDEMSSNDYVQIQMDDDADSSDADAGDFACKARLEDQGSRPACVFGGAP